MTQAKQRWSFSAGEWGRNRVCAFEHPKTGRIFLEFREHGVKKRIALGHQDRDAAKQKTEEVALALRAAEPLAVREATLRSLFDNYLREVTPQKGKSKQNHDKRAAKLFLKLFGGERKLSTRIAAIGTGSSRGRKSGGDQRGGRVAGKPVGNRVITADLKLLRSALKWALSVQNEDGRPMLDRNPLQGLPYPREESPRRPIVNDDTYLAL